MVFDIPTRTFEKEIKLGASELKSGGWRRDSILANTLEAVIGAIYLDSDINVCRSFILNIYNKHLEAIDPKDINDVRINSIASIKLDALPFQEYGDIEGTLVYVSEDTYDESLSGDKGAFYLSLIHISAPTRRSAS